MLNAFLIGLLAASSLLIGCLIALAHQVRPRTLAAIIAFGVGVLISAVAYDLVADSFQVSGGRGITLGLLCGSLTFFLGDLFIDRAGGANRKSMTGDGGGSGGESSGRAIVLGTVLDGIPESMVLGLSLLSGEGVSLTMLAAVFLSNLPEAMAATSGLRTSGQPPRKTIRMWTLVVLVSALASAVGYALLDGAGPAAIAFVQSFAAGAILTMLVDTMVPEAFEHGGRMVGLITTLGFAVAFGLASLEVLA
ncbi:MAG TPA: ZIP family zinc transporter [Actinomycetes bacterium]|nr:ZIP family zinc transporter [Actinomycetes bacterium]